MKTLWIRYTTIAAAIALAACSDRGNNNNGNIPTGPSCQSSNSGLNAPSNACDQCVQSQCQSAFKSAPTDCSDYLACNCACATDDYQCHTGCSDKVSAACQGDIESSLQCQRQSCGAQCGGGGSPSTGGGGFDGDGSVSEATAEGGSCAALAECCASLGSIAGAQSSCQTTVSVNDPNLCAGTLSGYQMGGACH